MACRHWIPPPIILPRRRRFPPPTTFPFINRSLGQLAALGDPIVGVIETAAANYLAPGGVANPNATLQGLATALTQISPATVTATPTVNGNLDTITLTLNATSNTAASVFNLSASGSGNTLTTSQSLAGTTTQNLNLTFGVDVTTPTAPTFEVLSASVSSNNTLTSTGLSGNATVNGTSETVASGSADIVADVAANFVIPNTGFLTTANLQSTPAAQIATITPTGTSSINLVTVTAGSTDVDDSVVAGDNLATPSSETLAVTQIPPSPLAAQVLSVFNDLTSEITQVESQITAAGSFAFDLPFIGSQLAQDLNPQTLFQPILSEISALETQVKIDLANSGTLLTKLQSDIVSALSSAGLLPDANPTSDVIFEYLDSATTGTQTLAAGSTVTLGSTSDPSYVTQLEIDLNLGQTVSKNVAVGANIGLPGLGLSLSRVLPRHRFDRMDLRRRARVDHEQRVSGRRLERDQRLTDQLQCRFLSRQRLPGGRLDRIPAGAAD